MRALKMTSLPRMGTATGEPGKLDTTGCNPSTAMIPAMNQLNSLKMVQPRAESVARANTLIKMIIATLVPTATINHSTRLIIIQVR